MKYNRLGKAGIKVSELSYGSWVTFGTQVDVKGAKKLLKVAVDKGINFFDNAEVYANGKSEEIMGEALKIFRREDIVLSTKIFWGGDGPNDRGLSWKHLVEGTQNSLSRLQVDYVDLLFCHRPDPDTPIEETVRCMNHLIQRGLAFYWGTSEWSASQLKEAFSIAERLSLIPPTMEQPQYNMLVRERVETEYAPLYENYGLGTTIWSPLASGALTGKYNEGLKKGKDKVRNQWVERYLSDENIEKFRKLEKIAKEIDCSMAQLAIVWCLKNSNVSTVILGASSPEQLKENCKSVKYKERLGSDGMEAIEKILNSHTI